MNPHRRRTRIRHGVDVLEPVAAIGWAQDEGTLPGTYAALKAELWRGHGTRLRGKATFRIYDGDEAGKAVSFLFEVYEGDDAMCSVIRRAAAMLREHGGLLVTCTAKAFPIPAST